MFVWKSHFDLYHPYYCCKIDEGIQVNIIHRNILEMKQDYWRILHIDDDEDDYLIVKSMLNKAHAKSIIIDWADSIKDGQQKLNENKYHAVIVDYDLGSGSGIDLVEDFVEKGYPAPMILLTGRGSIEVDIEAMKSGATLYLSKNEINPYLLERMIRYAIERNRAEMQLRVSEEKFSIIFDRSPSPTYLISIPDFRFVDVNKAFLDLLGCEKREILGKKALDIGIIQDRSFTLQIIKKLRKEGAVRKFESSTRISSGEIRTTVSNLELIEMDGKKYILGTAEDITERKEAEDALIESESRFRDMANNVSQLAWMADETGSIFWYNQRWFDYTGSDLEEVQGWGWKTYHHPDHLDRVVEKISRSFNSGIFWEDTFPLRGKDGQYRWFLSRAVPIRDEEGNVVRWFGTNTDVTEQLMLQEENQKQRDLLERILQTVPVGIAFLKGPDHVYYLVNDEYSHYARGKGELIGHTVAEKWPEIADTVIPQMDKVFQTGEPFSINDAPLQIIHDGLPEEEYFSYTFSPIYNADGSIEGVMILAVNTTTAVQDRMIVAEQSARLEVVLESLPVGVWIADKNGKLIGKNTAADRIWAGEAPLTDSHEMHQVYFVEHTKGGERLTPGEYPITRALETGQIIEPIELNIHRFDGAKGKVLVSAAPIKDNDGNVIGAVGINLDITERLQVEDALQESEIRFRQLADSMPQLVWTAEPDGTVDYYNQRYHLYGGIAPEEGDRWEWGPVLHPDDLKPTVNAWQDAVRTGSIYQIEHRARMADGSFRWHLSRGIPTYNEKGTIVKWFGTATDIHDFKMVQEALRLREERVSQLFDANLIGIINRELTGKILEANDAFLKITGYSKEDIEAGELNIKDIIPEEYHALDVECYQELMSNRRCKPYEKEYIRKDGTRAPVLIGYSLFEKEMPELIGFVMDLSELKKAQFALAQYAEKLKQSNEELENFAYVASHDLQEPLRKISTFGKRLKQNLKSNIDEEAEEYLERMISASERMQSMIRGLLDLSKVGTHEKAYEIVDLVKIAKEVVSDLEAQIQATGGEVIIESLPKVKGDQHQLQQLLQNLIGNGLKFHKDGITPIVRLSGELVYSGYYQVAKIYVEDNGIGFDEKNADKIFHPFVRLQSRSKYSGSGIGLAICRKIVERYGGSITASSRLGEGSRFTVTLPVKG
jgi:PAS domain S-box-containing protein